MMGKLKKMLSLLSMALVVIVINLNDKSSTAFAEALCGVEAGSICANTKAIWLGKHTHDLSCSVAKTVDSRAFYDSLWAGTCWSCEGWTRSSTPVNSWNACWQARSTRAWSAATQRAAAYTLAWDCPFGSFWHPDGTCWQCPEGYARSAQNIYGAQACFSDFDYKEATYLAASGCPAEAINKKPFLDIGAGGCYACPSFATRTIYDVRGDKACRVDIRWKTPPYPEPGLFKDNSTKTLLVNLFNDMPEVLTTVLREHAIEMGLSGAQIQQYVVDKWAEIGQRPYMNADLKAFFWSVLFSAANTSPDSRTPERQALVNFFENYIKQRRIFIAQDALDMYDTWIAGEDDRRANRAYSSTETLVDFGTTPPDYQGYTQHLMAAGAWAAGGIGTIASGYGITAAIAAGGFTNSMPLMTSIAGKSVASWVANASLYKGGFSGAVGGSAAAGAASVAVAAAAIFAITLQKVIEIENARPKLEAAMYKAEQDVDLYAMAQSDQDQLAGYYRLSISGDQCAYEKHTRLRAGGKAYKLLIDNDRIENETLKAYWIDQNGQRQYVGDIAPNERATLEQTYTGHPWVVTDSAGQCVLLFNPVTVSDAGFETLSVTSSIPASVDFEFACTLSSSGIVLDAAVTIDECSNYHAVKQAAASAATRAKQDGYPYLRTDGGWEQVDGGLTQISAGNASNVWGIDSNYGVHRWNGSAWDYVGNRPKLAQLSVGADGTLWALDASGNIYRWNGSNWGSVEGQLNQISVGSATHVWGIDPGNNIHRWNGAGWDHIDGKLKQVSVGADGTAWGIDPYDNTHNLHRWNGAGWDWIEGRLSQISAGSATHVWGVDPSDNIHRWNGAGWDHIDGKQLKQLSVGSDGTVWGVNSSNEIFIQTLYGDAQL